MNDFYAERVMKDAMLASTGGLDLDLANKAIQRALEALAKQAEALSKTKYSRTKPDQVSRAFNHTGKTLDEIFRLMQFSRGQPDSRPDLGSEWLKVLTDKQLDQVMQWVDENEREAKAKAGIEEEEESDIPKHR